MVGKSPKAAWMAISYQTCLYIIIITIYLYYSMLSTYMHAYMHAYMYYIGKSERMNVHLLRNLVFHVKHWGPYGLTHVSHFNH